VFFGPWIFQGVTGRPLETAIFFPETKKPALGPLQAPKNTF
jgi:hypothetical protein